MISVDTRIRNTLSLRHFDVIFLFGTTIYFVIFLVTLNIFPRVWMDSAWTTIAPYMLVSEGRLANPMLPVCGFDQQLLAPYIVQRLLLAGMYYLFGFGLFQSRVLSVIFGWLLAAVTYKTARKLYDKNIARTAFVFLLCDNLLFLTARAIRPEIFVAFFAMSGLFLAIIAFEFRKIHLFFVSGFLIAVSTYTHPNGIIVAMALLVLFFRRDGLRFVFRKRFHFWCFGFIVGISPFIIYVLTHDFSNGLTNFFCQIGGESVLQERSLLGAFENEVLRYASYIFFPFRYLIFVVQMIAVIIGIFSKNRISRELSIFVVTCLVVLPFWNPGNHTARYLMIVLPAVAILIAHAFVSNLFSSLKADPEQETSRISITGARWQWSTLLALYLVNQLAGNAYALWTHRQNDYDGFTAKIRAVIPEGKRTWGSLAFWINMHDYPYVSQITPVEKSLAFCPEYVILYDVDIWGRRSPTLSREERNSDVYRDVRIAMEQLCENRGVLLERISDEVYGDVEIYFIRSTAN